MQFICNRKHSVFWKKHNHNAVHITLSGKTTRNSCSLGRKSQHVDMKCVGKIFTNLKCNVFNTESPVTCRDKYRLIALAQDLREFIGKYKITGKGRRLPNQCFKHVLNLKGNQ